MSKFLNPFTVDIGIDLGTANTLVYVRGRGIVANEPSIVAMNNKTGKMLAIGKEAKKMVGRTPSHIVAIKPLTKGVISDFEVTEEMLRYFFSRAGGLSSFRRPRVVIGIPSGVTEVEKRAVEDAARNAGAREVFLLEEPMAAAIGAMLPVQEAEGSMVVDIGGGTTEIAVISLGGIVASRSLRIAGDRLTDDIRDFAQEEFKLLLGERTAEEIKFAVGSAFPLDEDRLTAPMRGRDLVTGLPRELEVTDEQIRRAMVKSLASLAQATRDVIEETPPELVADIMARGIVLAGGGALLRGLDQLLAQETMMPVHAGEEPLTMVVRGTGNALEELRKLNEVFVSADTAPMGF